MQALYSAIIALGRSATDARRGGWLCGGLGDPGVGPKCVNGLITWHLGATYPVYLHALERMEDRKAASLAGRALLRTTPVEALKMMGECGDYGATLQKIAALDGLSDSAVASLLATINDMRVGENDDFERELDDLEPLLNGETAAAWFERALDLLAKQLPEPIPATPPLTVEQILAAAPSESISV